MADKSPQRFKGHRWFAAMYDRQIGLYERRVFSKQRPWIVGQMSGRAT